MTYKLRRIVASGIVIGVVVGAAVGGLGGTATGAAPPAGSYFVVEISGISGSFAVSQCVGLGDQTTIITSTSGAGGTSYTPAATTPLQLVCTRGYDPGNDEFVDWRNSVLAFGAGAKTGLSLTLFSSTGVELDRWNYFGAWPFALEVIPSLDGGMREVVSVQADEMERL